MGDRHTQFLTGLDKGLGILFPFGLVEIDRKEMASVVGQQRIDTDRALTREVVVDNGVRQREQQAVAAV